MKVYINYRKNNEIYEEAITIYTNRGKLLYSDYCVIRIDSIHKFDNSLYSLLWGLKRLRSLCQNGKLSESEQISLFIPSQTVYHWLETEVCPKVYLDVFSEIQMELSLIVNALEIFYSKQTKALFKTTEKKDESLKSFMKSFKVYDD